MAIIYNKKINTDHKISTPRLKSVSQKIKEKSCQDKFFLG